MSRMGEIREKKLYLLRLQRLASTEIRFQCPERFPAEYAARPNSALFGNRRFTLVEGPDRHGHREELRKIRT